MSISHLTSSPIVTITTPHLINTLAPTSDEDTNNSKRFHIARCFSYVI